MRGHILPGRARRHKRRRHERERGEEWNERHLLKTGTRHEDNPSKQLLTVSKPLVVEYPWCVSNMYVCIPFYISLDTKTALYTTAV